MVQPKKPVDRGTYTLGGVSIPDDRFECNLQRQEISDLKIEKLGTRITFISILLPCFLIAILGFAYLDIKEKMASIYTVGQNDVKVISEDLEAKLNAMNVSMAKLKLSMDTTVPELLGSIEKVKAEIQETVSNKAGKKEIENRLEALQQSIDKNANAIKEAVHILDRTNQETLSVVSETEDRLLEKLDDIKGEALTANQVMEQKTLRLENTLKADGERMDDLGRTLLDFEDQIAVIRKDFSLIKIQHDDLLRTTLDKATFDREIDALKALYDREIEALRPIIAEKQGRVVKTPLPVLKPKPIPEAKPKELTLPPVEQQAPFVEKNLSQ